MPRGMAVVLLVAVSLQLLCPIWGQNSMKTFGTLFAGALPPSRKPNAQSSNCRFYINTVNTTTVTIQGANVLTSETVAAQSTFIYSNEGCSNRVVGSEDGLIEDKGYRIVADNPISVLVISEFGDDQMDSALLSPLDIGQNTYQFYTFTYQKDPDDGTFTGCGDLTDVASFFIIAATQDATSVTIQFPPPDYSQTTKITLDRYQTYTKTLPVDKRTQDYTGYYITADGPVSVISGTLCADATLTSVEVEGIAWSAIPELSQWVAGNYLSYEQFTYGIFGGEQQDFYRVVVLASEDNTLVTIAGIGYTINRGATVQYQFEDDFEKISCNMPCLVVQVSENRLSFRNATSTGIFQMQVEPIEDYGTYTAFTNYRVGALVFYFVRVVTTNDVDFRDIVISSEIRERKPWECKDMLAGGRACSWLGQIEDDQVQGLVQSFNPNANFSVAVYWSSGTNDGRGYGFNAGSYP